MKAITEPQRRLRSCLHHIVKISMQFWSRVLCARMTAVKAECLIQYILSFHCKVENVNVKLFGACFAYSNIPQ